MKNSKHSNYKNENSETKYLNNPIISNISILKGKK